MPHPIFSRAERMFAFLVFLISLILAEVCVVSSFQPIATSWNHQSPSKTRAQWCQRATKSYPRSLGSPALPLWQRRQSTPLTLNLYFGSDEDPSRGDPYCIDDQCYIPDDDDFETPPQREPYIGYLEPSDALKQSRGPINGAPFTAISSLSSNNALAEKRRKRVTRAIEDVLLFFPIVAPALAYSSYTTVQDLFTQLLELVSDAKWVAVDGGLYQIQIITPAINGIVVPSVAVLFATLVSNTVTTLRQRQLSIRTSLNMEASELRILQSMIDSFPIDQDDDTDDGGLSLSDYQDKCQQYLMQYTVRILAESQDSVNYNSLEYSGSIDSEMNALINNLNSLSCNEHQARLMRTNPNLLSESYAAITRLNAERATRISALQSTFPALHYGILGVLAVSILVTFLIESSQKPNLFLNQVQLQILWTILIGTFSALGTVLYDLTDPFRGSYQVSGSRRQLFTIRDAFRASAQMKANARSKKRSS